MKVDTAAGARDSGTRKTYLDAAVTMVGCQEAVRTALMEEAQTLAEEVWELLRGDDRRLRRAPITLAVRTSPAVFGPKLLWVRLSQTKRWDRAGKPHGRFTTVVPGLRAHKYRKQIFAMFDQPLRTQLQEVEDRAATLRRRTACWGQVFRHAARTMEEYYG